MCIYCSTNKYRKIYENHHGSIPIDSEGKSYDIHHIDGNHLNNDPNNLKAVTIQEHYDIHFNQGDYQACRLILLQRMNKDREQAAALNSAAQNKLIEKGIHHFLGETNPSKIASKNGTHPWTNNSNHPMKIASKNGNHHFIGGVIQKKNSLKNLKNGTHNFLVNHPSKIIITCPHCGVTGGKPNLMRHHFNNCKMLGKKTLLTCPHCGKSADSANIKRWHLDRCKHKIS